MAIKIAVLILISALILPAMRHLTIAASDGLSMSIWQMTKVPAHANMDGTHASDVKYHKEDNNDTPANKGAHNVIEISHNSQQGHNLQKLCLNQVHGVMENRCATQIYRSKITNIKHAGSSKIDSDNKYNNINIKTMFQDLPQRNVGMAENSTETVPTSISPQLLTTTTNENEETSTLNVSVNTNEDDYNNNDVNDKNAFDNHSTYANDNYDSDKYDLHEKRKHLLLTAEIQQKLIYDFAIKYKQTSRITLLTCRSTATKSTTNITSLKVIEILKLMCAATSPSPSPSPTPTSSSSTTSTSMSPSATFTTITEKTTAMHSSPGVVASLGNIDKSREQQQHKLENVVSLRPKGVLIKVVRIDQLINKSASKSTYVQRQQYQHLSTSSNTFSNGGDERTRAFMVGNVYANWLERVLRAGDGRRQIVVLDLECGETSRRLLQTASNKALFNSTFHWLLIEGNRLIEHNQNTRRTSPVYNGFNSGDEEAAKNMNKVVNGNKQPERYYVNKNISNGFGNTTRNNQVEDAIETIYDFMDNLNININTELSIAQYMTSIDSYMNGYYTLYDVWNPGHQYGGQVNITEIGNFTLLKGLHIESGHLKTSTVLRRINMNQARLRCMIVVTNKNRTDSLEDYLTTYYDTHLDSMNRFNFALLSYVRDLYNFSFVLSRTASWGYLKNGKFDGMIGALVRQQADIGGSPIFFRIERAKVIDYTIRTWVARPCFIFRHPRSTKKDRIVFLQPFSNVVWILLSLCGITTIILLWMLTSFETALDTQRGIAVPFGRIGAKGGRTVRQYESLKHNKSPIRRLSEQCALEMQSRKINVMSAMVMNITENQNGIHATANSLHPVVSGSNQSVNEEIASTGTFRQLLICWCNTLHRHSTSDTRTERRVDLLFESVLFYVGSICQQGLSYSTRFFSGRCIIITSLFFSFSIYQFYSASIVGTLLMEKPKTIRTLRDLIHSSLDIGIEDIVYNRDYFLRTKDPDAIELYAKKVTSVPLKAEEGFLELPPDNSAVPATINTDETEASKAKSYRDILHSHEAGAHAKSNAASNWYEPEFGVAKIKKGKFAFHVDVATAYKIIADTFNEKEICELAEIQLFPPQKMMAIVQKRSPIRKIMSYGMRRVVEAGLMDYQRKIWQSPKPRCVKQLHTDDLRVDMQTFSSAMLVLLFGILLSLITFSMELLYYKMHPLTNSNIII